MAVIETFSEKVQEMIKDICHRRDDTIEEFTKAYIAHLAKRWPAEEIMNHIELVEQWSDDRLSVRWYFREKNEIRKA